MICRLMVMVVLTAWSPALFAGSKTDYGPQVDTLLTSLGEVLSSYATTQVLKDSFDVAMDHYRRGDFEVVIDPDLKKILSGAEFTLRPGQKPRLTLGVKLLEIPSKRRGVVYSVLIHEMRHIHDYFSNHQAFLRSVTDEKEKYWFELDAMQIEARFLEECGSQVGSDSQFERFLLASWLSDNLASASAVVRGVDMNLFFTFDDLENRFFSGALGQEAVLDETYSLWDKNYAAFQAIETGDYEKFRAYISLKTIQEGLRRELRLFNKNPHLTFDDYYRTNPRVKVILETFNRLIEENTAFINGYLAETYQAWEEELSGGVL